MARVGEKIRQLRQELRISQQQLAGQEMTRSFISQVESGRCTPSPQTLLVIARRLSKPVEYFVADKGDDEALQTVIALLESAERDLEQAREDAEHAAWSKLQAALRCCQGINHPELEGRARTLLIECFRRQGKNEGIVEECERALECHKQLGDRMGMAQLYREQGNAYFRLEEFAAARRAYEKATLYSAGLKTMQEFQAEALMFLGSSLFRLGDYTGAIRSYKDALDATTALDAPVLNGRVTMGLGWAYFRAGDLQAAMQWTNKAISAFGRAKSGEYVLARHNLAIIQSVRNNWEEAYLILMECARIYQAEGRIVKWASVLEDLGRYWLHKGDLARGESSCWEAMDLLDIQDDGVLRGRLYRVLGIIAARQGNLVQARNLLRVSVDLLRRMRVSSEAAISMEELHKLNR